MATAPNEIEEIRRKMARIRRELHDDVRDVVEGAEAVSDWRHYVRLYPWAAVGAACALGYFVVPKSRKAAVKPIEVAQAVAAAMPQFALSAPSEPPKKSTGLIRASLGMLAPVVLRAVQNYATHFVSSWIAQQQGQVAAMMSAAGTVPQPPGGPAPGFATPGGRPDPTFPSESGGSRLRAPRPEGYR